MNNIFDKIYKGYDIFNKLVSLGLDIYWREEILKTIDRFNIQINNILDIGIGTGDFIKRYIKKHSIVGIDISLKMLKLCQDKLKHRVNLFQADAKKPLPFKAQSFDMVCSAFTFRHFFKDTYKVIDQIKRVLKTNKIFVILEVFNSQFKPFKMYCKFFFPLTTKVIFKDRFYGDYFYQTIEKFLTFEEFKQLVESLGFKSLKVKKFIADAVVGAIFVKIRN
jgi:demethylmenaquinone methyltransferase/2-methoxy-6-polyprenyl-1,4-benzoquinol methylase